MAYVCLVILIANQQEIHIMAYQIICLNDDQYYALATTRVFTTREAAECYADTVADTRYPLVVEGLAEQQDFDGAGMMLADYLSEGNIGGIL